MAKKKGRMDKADLISAHIEALIQENRKKSANNVYASNAGLCSRQLTLNQLVEVDNSYSSASDFYFQMGIAMERVIDRRLWPISQHKQGNVKATIADQTINGYYDNYLNVLGEEILVETKTCGALPNKPKPAHKAQLFVYLVLTGIKYGSLVYISRDVAEPKWTDNIKQKVFTFAPDYEQRRVVLNNMVKGCVYAQHGYVPDIPSYMRKSHCGFCPFKSYCWEGALLPYDLATEENLPSDILKDIDQQIEHIMIDWNPRIELTDKVTIAEYETEGDLYADF